MLKIKFNIILFGYLLLANLLWINTAPLQAEVALLSNGKTVIGHVVGQSSSDIQIQTDKGIISIAKKDVVKIQYVPFTAEQKRKQLEMANKKREAAKLKRQAIENSKMEKAERDRLIKEHDRESLVEKEREARERSARAEALRELVKKGMMEKPIGEPISYWDFTWRSLVLPGWGHFTLDRPAIGTFYMASTALLLGNVYEKHRIGVNAAKENHSQVELNLLLSLQTQLSGFEIRSAAGYYANNEAAVNYQKKIDNYNQSLYALELFYGLQLIHIIYNGIAWENGLLIVRNEQPAEKSLRPQFAILPDAYVDGRPGRGTAVHMEIGYYF